MSKLWSFVSRKFLSRAAVAAGLSLLVSLAIILSAVPVFANGTTWWNSDWKCREKLTLNNSTIAENLIDFPVGIFLNSSNFTFSQARSAGEDIRFIDADGATLLKYEIVSWSSTSAEIYVKVPQIDASSSTDYIWMYWNNDTCAAGSDSVNVWDSNFISVYHMNDKSGDSTKIADSTSHVYDGTKGSGSAAPAEVTGLVGKAQSFDGIDNYITLGKVLPITSGKLTIEILFKGLGAPVGDYHCLLSSINGDYGNGNYVNSALSQSLNQKRIGGTLYSRRQSFNGYDWNLTGDLWDGTNYYSIANGVLSSGLAASGALSSGSNNTLIGIYDTSSKLYATNGYIDEIRVSNTNRSAGWIAATNKSLRNTYISYGTKELLSIVSTTAALSVSDTSSTSRTYVPALIPFGVSQAVSLGMLTPSGLRSDILDGATSQKFMLASDRIGLVLPTLSDSQTRILDLKANTYNIKPSMSIIPGSGGYITTADDASLEPGSNFELEASGYIDTSTSSDLQSYSTGSTYSTIYGSNWAAQIFTPAISGYLSYVALNLSLVGAPTGNINVYLYATSSGLPTGSALCTIASIVATTVPTTAIDMAFSLSSPYLLVGNTPYAIVVSCPAGTSSLYLRWTYDTVGGYVGGCYCSSGDSGTTWTTSTYDFRFSAYIATSSSLVSKSNSLVLMSLDDSSITFGVSSSWSNSTDDNIFEMFGTTSKKAGERLNSFVGLITSATFKLYKAGSPPGDVYANVYKVSDGSLIGTLGSISTSTITTSAAAYTFSSRPVKISTSTDIRVVVEYCGGDASNKVVARFKGTDATSGGIYNSYSSSTWTEYATSDCYLVLNYYNIGLTGTAITPGVHTIKVTSNGTTLSLYDGIVLKSSMASIAIPNSSSAWTFMTGNISPYLDYIKLKVSGTDVLLYQPIYIISGTTLPDRQGTAQNGVITWGTNISLNVSAGGLVSDASYVYGGTGGGSVPTLIGAPPPVTGMYTQSAVVSSLPYYDLVTKAAYGTMIAGLGTVTGLSGTDALVGGGTNWTSNLEGALIQISGDSDIYTIQTVTDSTHITLTGNLSTSPTNASYMLGNGLGWSIQNLYGVFAAFVAIALGVGVTIATGSSLLGIVAVGLGLTMGAGAGVLAWWILLAYAIIAALYLTVTKSF